MMGRRILKAKRRLQLGRASDFAKSMSQNLKTEFRAFNADALETFKDHMREEFEMDVELRDPKPFPSVFNMLAVNVDKLAYHYDSGHTWPVMVKNVYQSPKAKPKSVVEIAQSRENFYLFQDDEGIWRVKVNDKVWSACQNAMAAYNCNAMMLAVFNPRNKAILVVEMNFKCDSFNRSLKELSDEMKRKFDP